MPKDSGLASIIAFCAALDHAQDRQALGRVIVAQLTAVGAIEWTALYILAEDGRHYLRLAEQGPAPSEPRSLPVRPEFDQLGFAPQEHPIPADSLGALSSLLPKGLESLLPLRSRGRLLGLCFLGPAASPVDDAAARHDRLTATALCAALALDNLFLWTESRQSRQLMRRRDRMRSLETMAAGLAHEIRNPLTSIKTFVTLAPERRQDAEFMSRFAHVAAEDVGRIERLIKEILDYAKSADPAFKPEDVNDVVDSSVHFLELTAKDRGITVVKEFEPDLPPVAMDRHQIQQVVMNLLINAVEAMAGGPGRLALATRRLRKHGTEEWVQIAVSDSGCGIPTDRLERIFDPFYTTKHESRDREGTGLGLAIAHQMVRDHRGYLDVTSRPGVGTTFFVNLPVHPPSQPPAHGVERRRSSRDE